MLVFLKVLFFVVLALAGFSSCTQRYVDRGVAVDEALARVKRYKEGGRYSRIIYYLEPRIGKFSGRDGIDTLVYFLAYAYLENRDFDKAQHQFRRLIDLHRASDLRPYAQYYLAQTYMRRLPAVDRDQHFTQLALRELFFFTELYPDHEFLPKVRDDIQRCRDLLAERIYRAGLFYMSRGEFSAARMYFSDVTQQYLDSRWVPFAYLKMVESYLSLQDVENAFANFEILRGLTIPEELRIDYSELVKKMSEIERPGVQRIEGLKRTTSESEPESEVSEPEEDISDEAGVDSIDMSLEPESGDGFATETQIDEADQAIETVVDTLGTNLEIEPTGN